MNNKCLRRKNKIPFLSTLIFFRSVRFDRGHNFKKAHFYHGFFFSNFLSFHLDPCSLLHYPAQVACMYFLSRGTTAVRELYSSYVFFRYVFGGSVEILPWKSVSGQHCAQKCEARSRFVREGRLL